MTEPVSPHDARHVEVLAELASEARKWLPPDSTLGQALDAALEPFKDAGVTEMTPDQAITIVRVRLSRSMRSAAQGPDPVEVLMDEVLRLRSRLGAERERCARIAEQFAQDVRDEIENEGSSVPMDCALTWLETAAIAIRKGAKS